MLFFFFLLYIVYKIDVVVFIKRRYYTKKRLLFHTLVSRKYIKSEKHILHILRILNRYRWISKVINFRTLIYELLIIYLLYICVCVYNRTIHTTKSSLPDKNVNLFNYCKFYSTFSLFCLSFFS